MWNPFSRTPKPFTGARVTSQAIERVQDNLVIHSIRKDAIQFVRVGRDKERRMLDGVVIYLHASMQKRLQVSSRLKGYRDVEQYMLSLPGIDKQSIVMMMESTSVEDFEVWRRP